MLAILAQFNRLEKPVFRLFFSADFFLHASKAPGPRDLVPVLRFGGHKQKFLANKKKRSLWPTGIYRGAREVVRRVTVAATVPPNLSVRAWPSASRGIVGARARAPRGFASFGGITYGGYGAENVIECGDARCFEAAVERTEERGDSDDYADPLRPRDYGYTKGEPLIVRLTADIETTEKNEPSGDEEGSLSPTPRRAQSFVRRTARTRRLALACSAAATASAPPTIRACSARVSTCAAASWPTPKKIKCTSST